MSRHRVPGTRAAAYRREIACGTNPTLALVRAIGELPLGARGVWSLGVSHDDGCPAMNNSAMSACTCEIVWLEAKRAA